MLKKIGKQWQLVVAIILIVPLILYALLCFQRPPRISENQTLFPGISYRRDIYSSPRSYLLHLVTVDLTAPGIKVFVTPAAKTGDTHETIARTTSEFLREFNLQLAINANYFYPFNEKTPWDFYPHTGDRVKLLGQSISNGNSYASATSGWAVLCISPNNHAQIFEVGECPSNTAQAVAGRELLIHNGTPVIAKPGSELDKPYPRTAVAVSKLGKTLWLIIVDGKQPFYSEGITLAELTEAFEQLGVDTALNLDGGGSTTLVAEIGSKSTLLSAPIHTKIPMRERPVANHLGFYAQK
jgi:uncharacterized protein YigE (DUF2233 family)